MKTRHPTNRNGSATNEHIDSSLSFPDKSPIDGGVSFDLKSIDSRVSFAGTVIETSESIETKSETLLAVLDLCKNETLLSILNLCTKETLLSILNLCNRKLISVKTRHCYQYRICVPG